MSDGDGAAPVLVLGPLLRYVGENAATIWVEADRACQVQILGREVPTFEVGGHHYALAVIDGLEPGRAYDYQVSLDGTVCWPEPDTPFPASVIRTLDPGRPLHLVFGSCRIAELNTARRFRRHRREQDHGADALSALALDLIDAPPATWPDLMLMIGDQVYADEVGPATRQFIRERRDPSAPPGNEIADFDEYCFLYREAWSGSAARWLLSVIPSAMIFDDHDVHDDWNISASWRRDFLAKPWWRDRIDGAYMSYWIYQHLGNLAPEDLAKNDLWREVRESADAAAVLRDFAQRADETPDGIQWSYRRTFGRVRLVVIDSRSGRVLDDGHGQPRTAGPAGREPGREPGRELRQMVSDTEWQWVTESVAGDWDHVVLVSSLPFLLPRGIHDLEAWNEAVCAGAWGKWFIPVGERMRRTGDLEHWAAFGRSFTAFEQLITGLAAGARGTPPASVTLLGGDVHHSYLAEVSLPGGAASPTAVHQLVCSPIHNLLPDNFRELQRIITSRAGAVIGGTVARLARVPAPQIGWRLSKGPWFSNMIAALDFDGRHARVRFDRSAA
ncbi:MAG TPA: alkaline phosphatase D family protein, partial [Streptosporangiaceae bacterium]|nr:alkaline phosphatase D family protein [Streptosporangiaceae bacterium]